MKNPNVGIEYRVIVKGEVVSHGSWFGKDAADFLNGINIAVGMGWLSPLSGGGTYVGLVGSDPIGGSYTPSESNGPDSIDNSKSANQACSISVAFSGKSINGMTNGINYYRGDPGVGFTVSISGLGAGGIARIGKSVVDRKGQWYLQQWLSAYLENTRRGESAAKSYQYETFLDSPATGSIFRYDNHSAGWIDHPGPNSINDQGREAKWSLWEMEYPHQSSKWREELRGWLPYSFLNERWDLQRTMGAGTFLVWWIKQCVS